MCLALLRWCRRTVVVCDRESARARAGARISEMRCPARPIQPKVSPPAISTSGALACVLVAGAEAPNVRVAGAETTSVKSIATSNRALRDRISEPLPRPPSMADRLGLRSLRPNIRIP